MKNNLSAAFNEIFNKGQARPLTLVSCPFCGCNDISVTEFVGLTASRWGVFCRGCRVFASRDLRNDTHATYTASISEWWNRRAKTQLKQDLAATDVANLFQPLFVEFCRAVVEHPKWPTDAIHASAILNEEAGELTQAAIDFHFYVDDRERMREEAIQVGAMALRFLMNFDEYKPEGGAV